MEILYRMSADILLDAQIAQLVYDRCSAERRKKADRCRTAEHRRQSLAASCLLDCALRNMGMQEQAVQYREGADGKPTIPALPDFHFNLSHSGNHIICAVSDREIGADVEMPREFSPRLLQRYFSAQERLEPLRVWVLKESFCKLTGVGIREIPTLEAQLTDAVSMLRNGQKTDAVFWEKQLSDGTNLAVCCYGPMPIQIQEIIIKRSDLI